MIKRNSANERVKRRYLQHLKETKGRDESSLDAVAKAIDRFEDYSKFRDFKKFHVEQVRAFKVHLRTTRNVRTGQSLSASTIYSTFAALKAFFAWLSQELAIGRGSSWRAPNISIPPTTSRELQQLADIKRARR
jgi:site-specific recombinase XerD